MPPPKALALPRLEAELAKGPKPLDCVTWAALAMPGSPLGSQVALEALVGDAEYRKTVTFRAQSVVGFTVPYS